MCYHEIYIFIGCGHSFISPRPVKSSPPCSSSTNEPFSTPDKASLVEVEEEEGILPSAWELEVALQSQKPTGSETDTDTDRNIQVCKSRMSHPMHTFRIEGQCPKCKFQREQRLARLEVRAIRDEIERSLIPKRTKDDIVPKVDFDFSVTSPGQKVSRRISFKKKIVAGAMDVAEWLSPTKPSFGPEALNPDHFALSRRDDGGRDSICSHDTETTSIKTSSD